jgi:hypothetical protein
MRLPQRPTEESVTLAHQDDTSERSEADAITKQNNGTTRAPFPAKNFHQDNTEMNTIITAALMPLSATGRRVRDLDWPP